MPCHNGRIVHDPKPGRDESVGEIWLLLVERERLIVPPGLVESTAPQRVGGAGEPGSQKLPGDALERWE